MSLLRANRQDIAPERCRLHIPHIVLALLLLLFTAVQSSAQLSKYAKISPSPTAPAAAPLDPLGRGTPRGSLLGFLKHCRTADYETAARYLQIPPGQEANMVELARELRALYPMFKGSINLLSNDPNGTLESGLPPDQISAGPIVVGSMTADVVLVRVEDPSAGKIWLISHRTLENIPKLYAQLEAEPATSADRLRLALFSGPQFIGVSAGQWFGWLLSIPISWLLAWLLTFLISAPRRAWYEFRKLPFKTVWETPSGMPLRCMIAILLHSYLVYLLEPPILYRIYYVRLMAALLVGCFGWLASTLSDQGFDRALGRTRTHHGGGESILILMQRLNRVGLFIVAFVAALAILGLNVKATLAGLGIGGLAVALAAQKTLENLIGGVSLLMDRAIQVGDFCKIGDARGTVEDVGLRSLKLRNVDQSLLVVPNGLLAQMQFENMKSRAKLLLNQHFSLRIETRVEQLRFVLDRVQTMLNDHPVIESGTSRVRVVNFTGAAFDLELFAYGKTTDWSEFTAVRQDVILKIAEIVEAAGTGFAAPTLLTYVSTDAGVDTEKSNDIMRQMADLRASDAFQLPGETRSRST